MRPLYIWIFIMLNNNLLISIFTTEMYGPYEYLP